MLASGQLKMQDWKIMDQKMTHDKHCGTYHDLGTY